jgi:hypothetical protein
MKRLLLAILLAGTAMAQPPASSIQIGSTNVGGGVSGRCLSVSSSSRLAQVVCGGGGGGSGTVTSIATGNGLTGGTITTSGTISGSIGIHCGRLQFIRRSYFS